MNQPTKQEIDAAITDLTLRSLIGARVGAVAKESDGIGYKRMGFWWMARVFGLRKAITVKFRDWRAGAASEGESNG